MPLYIFFGLPHKDLWAAVFYCLAMSFPFFPSAVGISLRLSHLFLAVQNACFFFLSFSFDCMYSDLFARRESNNRFLFITTLFEKKENYTPKNFAITWNNIYIAVNLIGRRKWPSEKPRRFSHSVKCFSYSIQFFVCFHLAFSWSHDHTFITAINHNNSSIYLTLKSRSCILCVCFTLSAV